MGYLVIALLALGGLVALGYFVFRLIKEIGPTMQQAKSTATTLQSTIEESKEIGEHFKSISESIQRERAELQVTTEAAREAVGQISNLISVVKPVGDAISLIKRQIEPKPAPVKAKRFLEKVQNQSRKAWGKVSKTVQKKISPKNRDRARILKFSGIPLIVGTAVGGYAVYWKRRKQKERLEDSSAYFTHGDENTTTWEKIRELPAPEHGLDSKKKTVNPE